MTSGTAAKVVVPGLAFKDNVLVVKAGDKVALTVTNCTPNTHNFVSPALGVPADKKQDIPPAADNVSVTFTAPDKPGKYMFWCTTTPPGGLSHAERGMTGEVIVQ